MAGSRISIRRSSGRYFYVRRVPQQLAPLDPRGVIRASLKTTDAFEAATKARNLDDALEEYWAALLKGANAFQSLHKYEAAVALAGLRGFTFRSSQSLAEGELSDLVPRLHDIADSTENATLVSAVMGGVSEIELKLSGLYDAYFTNNKVQLMGKSPGQMKRHERQRRASVQVAIEIIGDMNLADIKRADTLRYRQHWIDRVAMSEVTSASANRTMSDVKGMLTVVDDAYSTQYGLAWSGLRIQDKKAKARSRKRPPFSNQFITERLLFKGALDGMNDEAKCVTLLIVETGLRPSEAVNLRKQDIVLNAEIPYISVAERDDREQKTAQSVRTIPLVGVALWAARKFPEGFDRYRDKSDSFSAAANKYLEENGLKETDKHVVYSLRHSFQDRLIASGAQDRMQVDLMGHELGRAEYGSGATLAAKKQLLESIAFAPNWLVDAQAPA